jgi:hypothetical protein
LLEADAAVEKRLASVEALFGTVASEAELDRFEPVDTFGLVGQTVGRFLILDPLATGGMGVVYRAEDTLLGRLVALKLPLPHHRLERQVRERFLREARSAGSLDHPNVCSIHEAGETADGQLFLARHEISRDGIVFRPVTLLRAMVLEELGQEAQARMQYEAARAPAGGQHEGPTDVSIRVALGLAYAGLGRNDDARREARTATELVPLSDDNPLATGAMGGAVEVFARVGDIDAAIRLLELLLAMNAGREVSVPLLRVDPIVDPFRGDPRFAELLSRFARN